MDRYLCIHCHFYQPPRENPWLEAIELQDSAAPYHDWNERVTAECYAPNSAARILSPDGRISEIVNNYANISFNFGPTLLSWIEAQKPDLYGAILEADRESQHRFSGHGNAIAQAYNHPILPLSNLRDKRTQILWGLRDFEHRFERPAEGIWLPETAVDIETLEVAADLGVRYTILAPHQAHQVRKVGGTRFRNIDGAKIDPTRAYACKLPSGRTISLFFYDGPISQAVAFEGLLRDGENFASRLLSGFSDHRRWPQLMHIATDGETYGHHHRHGEMALAYALHHIAQNNLARITNYGEFLEKFPPTHEVEINERTAWSCSHGVERWNSNCGCNTGRAGWNQNWRGPLRHALDTLRDSLAEPFETEGRKLLRDPWAARDAYIGVVLDRSPRRLNTFFADHALRSLTSDERVRAMKLLEIQRQAMLMYTSCGWFFDELSGLETVQVIMYAGRAVQLALDLFGDPTIETRFMEKLREAQSNILEMGNGEQIYQRWVKPAAVDLLKVGAHYAISSIFGGYAEQSSIYCFGVKLLEQHRQESGRAQLMLGRAQLCSKITMESTELTFGVLHFGDHNVNAGVRNFRSEDDFRQLVTEAMNSFVAADLPQTIRVFDRNFEGISYSIKSLFTDERRRVLERILRSAIEDAENSYQAIYENHAPLMGFLADIGTPMPRVLRVTNEFVINAMLRRAFEQEELEVARIGAMLETARRSGTTINAELLSFTLKQRLDAMADQLAVNPREQTLSMFNAAIALVRTLPFEVDLWKMQNVYHRLMRTVYAELVNRTDERSRSWSREFAELGEKLGMRVEQPSSEPLLSAA